MNGDFSQSNGHLSPLRIDPEDNFSGVLHQQGRVLLDRDWNAQTSITTHWQDEAGRDVIGPAVAAVPAGESDGVRVQSAAVDASGRVELAIRPGRVWADGILAYLPGEEPDLMADVRRIATYLQPPIQDPPGDASTIDEGVRDAVILEVWREALNGFQEPQALIEPALGGPDTTERVLTAMRFRLFRLAPEDTCRSIVAGLQDDFENKGKLKVSLQPPTTIPGDCPVEEGGGYVGFEHFLYRVEIAQVDDPQPMFKWSQFNGGLVGRGDCDLGGTDKKIAITANDQAIKMSGLSDFYLEVVELDPDQSLWRVTYGAEVTLNGDDLEVAQERYKESSLPSGNVFFRLWTDIRPIADFLKTAAPAELRDGIRLEFDPVGATNYQPGDYWTFQVRAGNIPNLDVLIDDEPPQGLHYHRVSLAILNWDDDGDISFEEEEIEDCRDIFPPLTSQTGCCSFTVGDGVSSRGDFDSIEQAVRHLPVKGGDICLLPGLHKANVVIEDRQNIKVRGCDKRTKVIPREDDRDGPIFRIVDSQGITLERMDLITLSGAAVVAEGTEPGALQDVTIRDNRILAYENAVRAVRAASVKVHHNKMNMLDREGAGVAIYMMAEDSVIERNGVSVVPAEVRPPPPDDVVDGEPPGPTDPCADLEVVYRNSLYLVGYAVALWEFLEILAPRNPFNALGGIQIAGGSERVKVLENRVRGGAGNGITLGGDLDASTPDDVVPDENHPVIRHTGRTISGIAVAAERGVEGITLTFQRNDERPLRGVTDSKGIFVVPAEEGSYQVSVASPRYRIQSVEDVSSDREIGPFYRINLEVAEVEPRDTFAFIYEIRIDRNEISVMGLSGIGIPRVGVSDDPRILLARLGNPVVSLAIHRNHIFGCLQNPFDSALRAEARSRGFGGVALGLCANVSVHENRIENNGTTHVEPTCGLYLAYGERVEITHNSILDNGPIATTLDGDLQPGIRGGVVLGIASSLPGLNRLAKRDEVLSGAGPAARIHDNVVEQPAGQALRITAIGPVSVLGNYFGSELSGPERLDLLAGAVLIRNLWSMFSTRTGITARTRFSRAAVVNRSLANGNTLFNGNQTLVGSNNTSATSQLILSTADIGFDGNQSDNLKSGFLFSNTLLLGATLRASDNRLKEVGDDGDRDSVFASLLTLTGMLNNTTNNQGDHCIIAFNGDSQRPAIESGNQVLPAGAGQCQSRREVILRNPAALISAILRAIGGLGEIK